jgi:hypothetical protein
VEEGRPALGEGVDGSLVQSPGPLASADDEDDRPLMRQPEARTRLLAVDHASARGNRTADDAILVALEPVDREREEHAFREGRRETVREAKIRVRLGQSGADPQYPRREDDRSRDVSARTEDDVRPPAAEDPDARDRGPARERERTNERWAGATRKPAHAERVERVTRLRDELGLDAVRRAGERDADAAPAEGVGDRERRQDVTGGSPGRDQARERSLRRRRH